MLEDKEVSIGHEEKASRELISAFTQLLAAKNAPASEPIKNMQTGLTLAQSVIGLVLMICSIFAAFYAFSGGVNDRISKAEYNITSLTANQATIIGRLDKSESASITFSSDVTARLTRQEVLMQGVLANTNIIVNRTSPNNNNQGQVPNMNSTLR